MATNTTVLGEQERTQYIDNSNHLKRTVGGLKQNNVFLRNRRKLGAVTKCVWLYPSPQEEKRKPSQEVVTVVHTQYVRPPDAETESQLAVSAHAS